jgi:hypothetical protein
VEGRRCILKKLLCAVLLSLGLVGRALGAEVVVPLDTKPFTVDPTNVVRLFGKGIAGSKLSAKVVSGKAKIASTNYIFERKGGLPVIGNTIREFNIRPTGKGKVKVSVTVTSPIPGSTPEVTDYEFTVK